MNASTPSSITVVLDDSYPPYAFRDHAGRMQGIRKDVWDLWSRRTGIRVNLVGMDWAKAQAYVLAGQADVIDTIFDTGPRKALYDFGPAYADVEVPIFFHESIGGISTPDSLKGFTIGVKDGDACIDRLVSEGLETFHKYPSYEAVIDAAAVGEVRVFCEDRPPATYFLVRKQLERQFRASRPLYIGQFHWAVRHGDAATLKLVQDGFSTVSPGEIHDITERWLGKPIEVSGTHPYARYAVYGLLSVGTVALLLAAWNIALRRRVSAHTKELSASLAQLTHAKQHAEQTLDQLHATLEAIPDLMFELDLEGRYLDYRASRKDLLVAPPESLIGRTVREVMPPDTAEAVMRVLHDAAQHGSSSGAQIMLDLPQTGRRWFELSVARKRRQAGRDHFIVLSRDITDRKEAEQALARHGDELEKIVQERSRQLREARDISEQASRAKSEFLSRMSHELRTPMNAILGFSQLIEMDPGTPQRTMGHVQEILRAGKHLLHLINDVLDLEQVESGRLALTPEPIALGPLASESVALMRPLADQHDVALHLAPMPGLCVLADTIRVKQILLNLLSNAVKYNRRGGQVWIEACAQGAEQVRISVRDTGVGIAPDKLGQLFQPFNRLGAEAGHIEGSGIGLSLCRRLAELMHGCVGVDSVPGEGSIFWVDLPCAPPQAAPTAADQAMAGPLESQAATEPEGGTQSDVDMAPASRVASVLYIEDNPANLQLMEQIVARHQGVVLVSSPVGRLGLELARAHCPDLVLLDIHLPDIDGYAVLRQLREAHETREIPVVAVTANAMPTDVQRIREAGFDDYIAKPIKVNDIDQLLHQRLGSVLT